mmetsp:Transcript_53962/g.126615  ORF Transcript_53962/g.126615 Transcript_53962/m.126615 type:complete len:255 (+) Transcript_53962:657-1421(+)
MVFNRCNSFASAFGWSPRRPKERWSSKSSVWPLTAQASSGMSCGSARSLVMCFAGASNAFWLLRWSSMRAALRVSSRSLNSAKRTAEDAPGPASRVCRSCFCHFTAFRRSSLALFKARRALTRGSLHNKEASATIVHRLARLRNAAAFPPSQVTKASEPSAPSEAEPSAPKAWARAKLLLSRARAAFTRRPWQSSATAYSQLVASGGTPHSSSIRLSSSSEASTSPARRKPRSSVLAVRMLGWHPELSMSSSAC